MSQSILFTKNISQAIEETLSLYTFDKLFILTDTNTHEYALPLLLDCPRLADAIVITIKAMIHIRIWKLWLPCGMN